MQPRFVGRSAELDELVARFEDALAGRPGVVLVAGEPGIGKTRLVAEVGRIAGTRAVPVLWGTCTDEDGAPAYWPWRQILRAWLATGAGPPPDLVPELARIAPELGTPSGPAGPEQRFATFDAATRLFAQAAAAGGLVLVLDDAQWADPASTALLVHLARHARDARLLLAVTYRPRELADDTIRAEAVSVLAQLPGTLHLQLRGLDDGAIADALAERLGTRPAPDVVAAVAARTRGNPFFVGELARLMADPAAPQDEVPGAVRDAVRRRLDRLPPPCRAVLDVAAVLGREFDPVRVAEAADRPTDAALDELAPALDDGLLDRPRGRVGLRFGHDLVRETLLAELAPAQRARIHQRLAALLEPLADDPDVAPELAHHALAALPLGDPAAAVRWARRAAERATAQLAHEEAARLLGLAVDAGRGVLPAGERGELLLAAAQAHAAANDVAAAAAACTEAADLARHTGDHALLGRAALVMPGMSDVEWLAAARQWSEEALRRLDDGDSPLRAMLLAQLCHALVIPEPQHEQMDVVSAEALAIAERLGDRESLVSALRARQLARSGADGLAERISLGERMLALGTDADAEPLLWGRAWRFDAFLQAGRVDDAEHELDLLEPVVARLRRPLARLHLLRGRVALAAGRGRFADAARLNDEALRIAQDGGHIGPLMTARAMIYTIDVSRNGTGDPSALAAAATENATPFTALVTSSLALGALAAGRRADAQQWYDRLPPPDSRRIPPFMVLPLLAQRAHLAADLGDAAAAETCHRLLLPHADLHAVSGAGAVTTGGSVQLYLGLAAAGAGRTDAAVRHLRAAISANDAAGLAPFAATARMRLAATLRSRGRPGDADEAVALLAAADTAAERMGMPVLLARIAELSGQLRDGGVLSRRETEIAELVADGLTNKQVALSAHISERTVESHVQHIMAKLGFSNRSQIAAWVARRAR
ncbi:ATP-binding protein [Pseudonocardia sp. CA-107938]|uniref:ATP-binding protein n=1 Tax=Pseudonocardia sp. CA-107938 TaxID=3240021 RepID=UPI003D906068